MGELYIVATPIGNMQDITLRALETLKQVDLILAEDTRVTRKLLERYEIKKEVISYHQHSQLQKVNHILDLLREGKKIALVSDSGTPGISDPGALLVKEAVNNLKEVKVYPIPGPSAITACASISGFFTDKFLFLGFPPSKKKRKRFFSEVAESKYPVILYESPHRILKTLSDLKEASLNLEVVLCRELTKKFETVLRGNISEVEDALKRDVIKGEFVLIAKNAN